MMHSHSPSPSRFPFTSSSNNSKAESIVKNFYIKAAQIIIQSRQQPQQVSEDADGKKRTNRWFNMDTREYPDSLRSELKFWITKAFLSPITQPPPLVIEVYLDVSNVPPGREVALQSGWRLVDLNAPVKKDRIVLEHWTLALNHPLPTEAIDLGSVYKRSILFFRTLYAFVRLLPAYAAYQRIMADTDDRHSLDIGYRLTNIANSKGDEIGLGILMQKPPHCSQQSIMG
ncbi:autophagy-related protein 13 [Zychaea mexicana]|uniref:autophagy-related protein 13 n=1 Tax=Zychaea mexicana TaxID=64656 RepID=UPI0022FDB981|nr:autophagy-related protein 13 [Zychaea mexicana]KAI9489768.1 autophagy-related protein 13 [Zychaea mexicana]